MRNIIRQVLNRRLRLITGIRVGIRCGTSPQYTDSRGQIWLTDRYFYAAVVGSVLTYRPPNAVGVMGTPDPELYSDARYADNLTLGGNINWGYNVPVNPGIYRVSLLYAEIFMQPATPGRLGTIDINGIRKLTNFNQVAVAGQNTAYQMVFTSISPVNGFINIAINSVSQNFYITALELTPI